jgi:hypothetical protein
MFYTLKNKKNANMGEILKFVLVNLVLAVALAFAISQVI